MRKRSKVEEKETMKVPQGYAEIVGTMAPVWQPKAKAEFIEGVVTGDRIVNSKKGAKKLSTRLLTLAGDTGTNAVWVSAGLAQILEGRKSVIGCSFMIVYEGTKKIKGQGNPMKVFRVFEKGGPRKAKK